MLYGLLCNGSNKKCCAKGEDTIDHLEVTRWFKKFCSGFKNFNDQAMLGKFKSMDSEAILQSDV